MEEEDKELVCQMAEMWGAYVGDPVSRQSLRFAWMEGCCGGGISPFHSFLCLHFIFSKIIHINIWCDLLEGEMFVESTFEAILSEIAKIPLEKATIHLNQKVISVRTKDRDVAGSKVILTTEKGGMFDFDEVVMTTPLGWLKRNKRVFEPALPDRLLSAIDSVSVGRLEKVSSPSSSPSKHNSQVTRYT